MKDTLIEHRETAHASMWSAPINGPATPQLRLNVLATSERATVAALRAASGLAANLRAHITLTAIEVVPWQFPLEKPPVAIAFLEQKLCRLVCEAGIVGEEVRIRLYLCRDERQGLGKALRPHSLIVLGGADHWWSRRERTLHRFLTDLGHQVIFVTLDESDKANEAPTPARTISSLKSFAFHGGMQHTDLGRGHK